MRIRLLLFALLASFTMNAQNFGAEYYDTTLYKYHSESKFSEFNYLWNSSSTNVIFNAKMVDINIPSGWGVKLCDRISCATGTVIVLEDTIFGNTDDQRYLWATCEHNGIGGTGTVEIELWDRDDPNDKQTINYTFVVWGVGQDEIEEKSYSFYPNPSSDVLNVRMNSNNYKSLEIEFFDGIGKSVSLERVPMNGQVNISSFPNGVYYFRLRQQGKYLGEAQQLIKN